MQAVLATVPLLVAPLLLYGLAEGILDFGGGEKDIILIFPWITWSVIFAICAYVLIIKGLPVLAWSRYAFAISIFVMAVLFVLAYVSSYLGIAPGMPD